MKFIKKILALILILLLAVLFSIYIQKPTHNRNWERESEILPEVSIKENLITIKNVRDFKYSATEITSLDYLDRTIDSNKVKKVYYLIEPFAKWDAVAHSYLSFGIEGEEPISFSVEARREEGESFSAFDGFFNNYELWYVWGTETDLIIRRALYLNHPLYMYEVDIKPETARAIFLNLIQKTKNLSENAKFYNTITSNCTNELARSSNTVNKGSIPLHYSWVLTGYSDEYLYKLGLIKNDKSLDEIKMKSYITEYVKEIANKDNFSVLLRDFLSK